MATQQWYVELFEVRDGTAEESFIGGRYYRAETAKNAMDHAIASLFTRNEGVASFTTKVHLHADEWHVQECGTVEGHYCVLKCAKHQPAPPAAAPSAPSAPAVTPSAPVATPSAPAAAVTPKDSDSCQNRGQIWYVALEILYPDTSTVSAAGGRYVSAPTARIALSVAYDFLRAAGGAPCYFSKAMPAGICDGNWVVLKYEHPPNHPTNSQFTLKCAIIPGAAEASAVDQDGLAVAPRDNSSAEVSALVRQRIVAGVSAPVLAAAVVMGIEDGYEDLAAKTKAQFIKSLRE